MDIKLSYKHRKHQQRRRRRRRRPKYKGVNVHIAVVFEINGEKGTISRVQERKLQNILGNTYTADTRRGSIVCVRVRYDRAGARESETLEAHKLVWYTLFRLCFIRTSVLLED